MSENMRVRCRCGESACESELCDCDAVPCPVNHRAEAERDALKAELARIKDAEPTPCPVDHSCEGEQSCGCWCDLHDVPIAYCPTFMLVSSWIESRDRELAEARAALERVRAVHVISDMGECVDCRASWPCPSIAALDASQRSRTDAEGSEHTDAHGRTWDPHPFVQSRRVCRNVCVCGVGPDHEIHQPAPESPEDTRKGTDHA